MPEPMSKSSTTWKTPPPLPVSALTEPQQAAIDRLYERDETLLLAGLGFGKAIVGLTAIQDLLKSGHLRRVLVLAPKQVCDLTWAVEPGRWEHIAIWAAVATGGENRRRAVLDDPEAKVVVTNFENLRWVIDNYGHTFDGLLVDEMTKLKSAGGATVRALRHWVKKLKWRAGMTGTPVAESGLDIYSQALLLDLGKALGTRKDAFLRKYFYPTDYQQYNWVMQPGAAERISIELQDLLYCADDRQYREGLPAVETLTVSCRLDPVGRDIYDQISMHSVFETAATPAWEDSRGVHTVTCTNAAVRTGKLQQIAAGGLYDDNGDVCWLGHHKMEQLAYLLQYTLTGARPLIIVYQYSFELAQLRELLGNWPTLGAGEKFTTEMQGNWNRGSYKFLFMHPRSAAHGLNLQYGTDTIVHLSPCWSADQWIQTLGRIRRRGQPSDTVTRYVLLTEQTVDDVVALRLQDKAVSEDELMRAFGQK